MLLLFFCTFSYAQLPAFDLNVVATNETCPGNGTLTCTVSNTDPAATIIYRVYLLPNTTTPIAVLATTNFLDGLTAGNYRVIATQTLAPDSNTQTMDVTITDETIPLLYTISGTNVSCGNNGTMTIHPFSGTAVSYEIIAGPMTAPLQTSPFFSGLAAGEYQIRVFDACGQGWVITHTLFVSTGNFLNWAETDESTLVDCNQMTITNTLSPSLNESLSYPITVTYTINPPGGGTPIVQTTTMASGDVSEQEFVTVIPYYSDQVYNYSVTVTDGCGNGYYFENILISKKLLVELRSPPAECGEYMLTFAVQYYMPPFNITFTDMPAGFDPVAYNPGHPGPFSTNLVNYGNSNNGVPYGHYAATITDACGHTVDVDATLEYKDPEPQPDFEPHDGCDSDISNVNIKVSGYILDSAIITSGPPEYSTSYPIDVTALIDPLLGNLQIPNMNAGTYMIVMTDTCGNNYNYELVVTDPGSSMNYGFLLGCEPGHASVRINASPGIDITSVAIISAPASYTEMLPQDVSFNISPDFSGIFSMTPLPEGTYIFEVSDSCGFTRQLTIELPGYVPTTDDTYTVIPHCGSFDLNVHFPIPGVTSVLWLQRYDPATNTWGNPQTGVPYFPGDTPNDTNSYRLTQLDGINYNIAYLGDFRILHRFQTFGNASVELYKICVEELYTFTVLNEIEITDIQKATCDGVNSDVSITAIGVPPLTYQITSMNTQPFFVNNGTNNVFASLQPAVYNFQVTDDCGNVTNQLTDVALLPSLVSISQPGDLIECDGADNDGQAEFNLSGQNSAVLGSAPPASFTITYYLSQAEATTASNPLPGNYVTDSREIFVRMQYNNVSTCYDTASFHVIVNEYPMLDMALSYAICEGENVTITADTGFDSYEWSTGRHTPTITVDEPGTYTLEVTQTTNGVTCTATYSITVVPSQPAEINHIETTDWTNDQNTISVILNNASAGNYSYSLDNEHFQPGNTFYGLEPGVYTVYIKDENGCDGVQREVYLLAYPKFFTPNGDGYNDFWQIYYARMEPNLKVYVFDRYGKLLTGFGSDSVGWDGRYNGKELPSTDYWFLVVRQNGKEERGHFSMKR
jgi:gliding motility-associated-like protein